MGISTDGRNKVISGRIKSMYTVFADVFALLHHHTNTHTHKQLQCSERVAFIMFTILSGVITLMLIIIVTSFITQVVQYDMTNGREDGILVVTTKTAKQFYSLLP